MTSGQAFVATASLSFYSSTSGNSGADYYLYINNNCNSDNFIVGNYFPFSNSNEHLTVPTLTISDNVACTGTYYINIKFGSLNTNMCATTSDYWNFSFEVLYEGSAKKEL